MIEMRDSVGPDIQPALDLMSAWGPANWTRQGGQQWAGASGYVSIPQVDAEAGVIVGVDHSQVSLTIKTWMGDYKAVWLLAADGFMKPSTMAWEPVEAADAVTEPVSNLIAQATDVVAALIVAQMRWVNETYRGGQA
jgi:hypothetical protein